MATKEVIDATTNLIKAVEGLVRATGGAPPTKPTLQGTESLQGDSPAWLAANLPGGSEEVGRLGEAYLRAHVSGELVADANNTSGERLVWDPAKGATWKDFARIYRRLFDPEQVFEGNGFKDVPFARLRGLQAILHAYDVNDPEKVVEIDQLHWPNAAGFPPAPAAGTSVRRAVSSYLAAFNQEPDGDLADRATDFNRPAGSFELSHAQCVELHHALITQEDIRLVAPYDTFDRLW